MSRSRESNTLITRNRIVDCASELITSEGLGKMSVSAVARRLGMTHANIYRHFDSKNSLVEAVAKDWMQGMRTAYVEAIEQAETIEDKLKAYVISVRAQLRLHERGDGGLDLYRHVQNQLPDLAYEHLEHRYNTFETFLSHEIITPILDSLAIFTDPIAFKHITPGEIEGRVSDVCRYLAKRAK